MSKQTRFPKQVYVTREDEGTEDEYLSIRTTTDDIDHDVVVAVYALVETKRVVVTRELK